MLKDVTAILESAEGFVLRPVDPPRDAQGLIDMWKTSEPDWPGGTTAGIEQTIEGTIEELESSGALEQVVWDTGETIAGFCRFEQVHNDPSAAYIALINVRPDFQGRSLGRLALLHYVHRATELGYTRVDLNTWPGNLKAVPLYKKCGYFWMPDRDVSMHNHVPEILAMPMAQKWFEGRNWYTCFKRELNQTPDEELWEGMKVFTYRFADGPEVLIARVDREALRVAAIETGGFAMAAVPASLNPAFGQTTPIQWRIHNRRQSPATVSLLASGDHLAIDFQRNFVMGPGERVTFEAPVKVATEIPDKLLQPGAASPSVRTILNIDGELTQLRTGMRPLAATEVSLHPSSLSLIPGNTSKARIQLRNRMDSDVAASIRISASNGLKVEPASFDFSIGPKNGESQEISLTPSIAGPMQIEVMGVAQVGNETLDLRPDPLPVFSRDPGSLFGCLTKHSALVENDFFRLSVHKQGATTMLSVGDTDLGWHRIVPAPPDWPNELAEADFNLSLRELPGKIVVTAQAETQQAPRVRVVKEIEVTAGCLVRVSTEVQNRGPRPVRLRLQSWWFGPNESIVTVAYSFGLTQSSEYGFPGHFDDSLKKAGSFSESWAAFTKDDHVAGLIWGEDIERVENGWNMSPQTALTEIDPGQSFTPKPIFIYAGRGDHRAVREAWRRLRNEPDPHREGPQKPVLASFNPAAQIGTEQTELVIENRVSRPIKGEATIHLPEGWTCEPQDFRFEGIKWDKPFCAPVSIRGPGESATARVNINTEQTDKNLEVGFVRLRNQGSVDVEQRDGLITVRNGLLEFDVAPSFGPSLVCIRSQGIEYLHSSYPAPTALSWTSPWFGGIQADLQPAQFHLEEFEHERIDGVWSGVRLKSVFQREIARGLGIEIDHLTLPGSAVLKIVARARNYMGIVRRVEGPRLVLFALPAGQNPVLTGLKAILKPTAQFNWKSTAAWCAAFDPSSGATISVTAPAPMVTGCRSLGLSGQSLSVNPPRRDLDPHGSVETVAYVAISPDPRVARNWRWLKDLS